MRTVFGVLVIAISSVLGSCSSDSDSSKFTAEERELRALLNHEWEATDADEFGVMELPISEEDIEMILDHDWSVQTGLRDRSITVGMNKKGGFYFIDEETREYIGKPLNDLLYSCTAQQGNKFSGIFTGISAERVFREFYVRKVDENTMNLAVIYKETMRDDYPYVGCSIYAFKKKGAWNESTNFRKIFQRYRYYDDFIDKMILAEEDFERNEAMGGCQ